MQSPALPALVYALPMSRPLRQAVQSTLDMFYDGIRRRPAMFGTPAENEAVWWTLLWFEATLLDPIPDDAAIGTAIRDARERVANDHNLLAVLPFHVHVGGREKLVQILDEWRVVFLARLGARPQ